MMLPSASLTGRTGLDLAMTGKSALVHVSSCLALEIFLRKNWNGMLSSSSSIAMQATVDKLT
jgi:hypothetical protein